MTTETGDSNLVRTEREFTGAWQLGTAGPLVIIGASQSGNPELKFAVEFNLKKELHGVHPRLVTDDAETAAAAKRYRENPDSFAPAIPSPDHGIFTEAMPVFPYNQPGDVGINAFVNLARLAVTWRVTGGEIYLKRLENWIPFLENFQVLPTPNPVSIVNGKKVTIVGEGNYTLITGHILLGLSLAYDALAGKVEKRLESALRKALVEQASLSHADYSRFSNYPYEQNHLIIPLCGIGLAAIALADEVPDAKTWGSFAQGMLDRCLETIGHDGWFFEGVGYWNFTMQFCLTYAYASLRATGADWFSLPIFKNASRFISHMFLPDPDFAFDFNDHGPRVETDGVGAQPGYYDPWHTLKTKVYFFLPRLLQRCQDDSLLRGFIAKIADRYPSLVRLDPIFFLLWPLDETSAPDQKALEIPEPPYHYFSDMEIAHWRQNWTDADATAIAFRSSPPAGHHVNELLPRYPNWKMGIGHAHPDAGSFILFSKGKFLANDTAYSGAKETADHNSILVDGVGQHEGGTPWACFDAKPYGEYNKLHLGNLWLAPKVMASTAFFKDAYVDTMQLREMRRDLILVDGRFLVTLDTIESEIPHEYEWRLHGDREAAKVGECRFVMENTPARLVFESLNPIASHAIDPTIIETEVLFRPQRSRPMQRGFHVALTSAKENNHQFLVAYGIQSVSEKAAAFTARKVSENKIELTDERGSCTIWIGFDGELDGHFAYILRDVKGAIRSAGLSGKSLAAKELSLKLDEADSSVTLAPHDAGDLRIGTRNGNAGTLEIAHDGKSHSLRL